MAQTGTDAQMLATKCEEAILTGRELLAYARSVAGRVRMFPLASPQPQTQGYRQRGFFDRWKTNGHVDTIMGCEQAVIWRHRPAPFNINWARQFVFRDFLRKSSWHYPSGRLGGFGVRQILLKGSAGNIARCEDDDASGAVDWRELGGNTVWSMIRIDLHDLAFAVGPLYQRFAVYVVQHPDFASETLNPDPDTELELRIAYPFVSAAPIPNFLGFGPGKFQSALKTYEFCFRKNGEIEVSMLFLISPRSIKLTALPGPDPFYATMRLVERMSLGSITPGYFKNTIEAAMLSKHCHVHKLVVDHAGEKFYTGRDEVRNAREVGQ